ncbi:MAG TPA: carbohydrate kinase family protein [Candidatus Lokiarchaeia archaeon]
MDTVFQIDEITPVNSIIKSNFASKILLSPNLQDKMSFEGIDIRDNVFDNAKIIFTTPIAKKFVKIFENSFNFDLITAFKIEKQNISNLEELSELIKKQYDIFFLNLIDAQLILNEKLTIEEIDKKFQLYAKIRTYTNGKEGSYIFTDNINLKFSSIELKEVIDHTGLEDFYSAGFLTIIYHFVEHKFQLLDLLKPENEDKLKSILNSCGKFATYTAIYKITKQTAPTKEEFNNFMKDFKIN